MVDTQLNPESQIKLNLKEIALHLKFLPRPVIANALLNQIILDIKAISNETNAPHRQAAIEALQAQINQELTEPSASFTKMKENLTRALRNFKGLDAFAQKLASITATSNRDSIGNEIAVSNIQTLIKSAYYLFAVDPSDEKILKTLGEQVKAIRNSLIKDHKTHGALAFFGFFQPANPIVSALDRAFPQGQH